MPNLTRDLVHDTQATSIIDNLADKEAELTGGERNGNNLELQLTDFKQLAMYFMALKLDLALVTVGKKKAHSFNFSNTLYLFIAEQCHIVSDAKPGSKQLPTYLRAELVFKRFGDTAEKWIALTYTLYMHNKTGPVLSFVGNPTTIINGSNIRPIRISGATPFQETLLFFRMGFDLLMDLFPQFKWSKQTLKRLQTGQIRVSNVQWALYLPSANKHGDLTLLAGLYAARLMDEDDSCSLGEYLGFETSSVLKGSQGKITGLFMVKKHGKHHVLTINFYDKRQSVANKKQSLSINADEAQIIDNALRVDITAHAKFITRIIIAARARAEELIAVKPQLRQKLKRFLLVPVADDSKPTAYRLCRAISILSIEQADTGLHRGSFTTWLIERVLNEEMRLGGILQNPNVETFVPADSTHKAVVDLWRQQQFSDDSLEQLIQDMIGQLKYRRRAAFAMLHEIDAAYKLDLAIPYRYWRDKRLASLTYGLSDKEKSQFIRAHEDSSLGARTRVNTIDTLRDKSNRKLVSNMTRLQQSLRLVAKQISASEYKTRVLEKS